MELPWWLPFGAVPEIAPASLLEQLDGPLPPQLLDVRTLAEWRHGHIRGALSVPVVELPSRLHELPFERQRAVVAICLTAHRSVPAVRLLRRAGFGAAVQLAGGMRAWWAAKLPVDGG